MDIPATLFVALGAIIAALITSSVAFVNLIISKDQKVSEFRQAWIDEQRKDISNFIGYTSKYSLYVKYAKEKYPDKSDTDKLHAYVAEVMEKEIQTIAALYSKIILGLNPKDDKLLIEKLKEIESSYSWIVDNLGDTYKTAQLTSELRDLSQVLLKKEWKRVKRGEISYFLTKYFALAIVTILIIIGIYYKNDAVTLFKQATPIREPVSANKKTTSQKPTKESVKERRVP